MTKLLLKVFQVKEKFYNLFHNPEDVSRTVCVEGADTPVLCFDYSMRVTTASGKLLGQGLLGPSGTWGFREVGSEKTVCTGFRSTESAEVMFSRYILERHPESDFA